MRTGFGIALLNSLSSKAGEIMSKAIEFLEALGSNPALIQPSMAAYADAVVALDVDEHKRSALLTRDVQMLSSLLGGRLKMAMSVATPDGGEESQEVPERRDDDQADTEEKPQEKDRPN